MFHKTNLYVYLLLFIPIIGFSQSMTETSYDLEKRMPLEAWDVLTDNNSAIQNISAINNFLEDLHELYATNKGRVRITHIGDSHIQAGFFQTKARKDLQSIFGNAGLGFTFPHRLASSNGISELRYTSSIPWESKRNIHASETDFVGLSGFSLQTNQRDFAIALEVKDDAFAFNTLRVFTPNQSPMFSLALANREVKFESNRIERKQHTIKSGEALSIIARNYGVSVAAIKQANNLRSDAIRAGAKLTIPVKTNKPEPIDKSAFSLLAFMDNSNNFIYNSPELQRSIWLLPNEGIDIYSLNGISLERDNSGLIYDGIGVNGARFSDYNKTKLFFEQLKYLDSDLLIISLGTNEAFDKLEKEKYLADLKSFVSNLRELLPEVSILFTTPPPSLVGRSAPNTFAEEYAMEIRNLAEKQNIAVWDLYKVLGGNEKIRENYTNGLVARDYIHYTVKGYELAGSLFSEALLQALYHYSINSNN
ncbi:MAG TPA: GDSL-type esterase/lipase family protein [Flavobacteriaceae bacterium]|nr:GDSL-type esterase/lipase family protein [Flavobacteriaceae bacterium]